MELPRFLAERVTRRLPSGSSSPVVVETEAGRFVTKLRGAGHGVQALVAEIVVAELAEALGLAVPERALVELARDVPSDDRNDELADLLRASVGLNVGLRFLAGAAEATPAALARLSDEFAARVLWLDGLVMNLDRTPKNPNVLVWNGQPWLIDHGSALVFHHDWASVDESTPREPGSPAHHAFGERHSLLSRYDAKLAARLTEVVLEAALERVPEDFMALVGPERDVERSRSAYRAFLWKRLKPPRPFVKAAP